MSASLLWVFTGVVVASAMVAIGLLAVPLIGAAG